jgi:recyclin-1
VEHIIQARTPPRAYCDVDDIGPTPGTGAALACLARHCALLRGSAGKEVLEVFYQEVGFRLIACVRRVI